MNIIAALIVAFIGMFHPTAPVAHKAPMPTVAAYRAMFDAVPVSQWGGADVTISTPVCGKRVWLFGDTLIQGKGMRYFAHNTGMVQKGMRLHVSMGGMQTIPNAGNTFYWPETVKAHGCKHVIVTLAPVKAFGKGLFDFKRNDTMSRKAVLSITPAGDLVFAHWAGMVKRPSITGDGEDLKSDRYGHYLYQEQTHSIRVKGGHLHSTNQNWDDGKWHPIKAYRPIFSIVK
jgi:hypothetical protein